MFLDMAKINGGKMNEKGLYIFKFLSNQTYLEKDTFEKLQKRLEALPSSCLKIINDFYEEQHNVFSIKKILDDNGFKIFLIYFVKLKAFQQKVLLEDDYLNELTFPQLILLIEDQKNEYDLFYLIKENKGIFNSKFWAKINALDKRFSSEGLKPLWLPTFNRFYLMFEDMEKFTEEELWAYCSQ